MPPGDCHRIPSRDESRTHAGIANRTQETHRLIVATLHLGEARQAGPHLVSSRLPLGVELEVVDQQRPRSDQAHVSAPGTKLGETIRNHNVDHSFHPSLQSGALTRQVKIARSHRALVFGSMTRIYLSPPDVGPAERAALLDAFDSGWVAPVGPYLDRFEEMMCERTGSAAAAALSSGTAALHLALLVHGVEAGDDVFVSTFTFAATANAVRYVGAQPVFIDSDEATWNMSPELLEGSLEQARQQGSLPAAVIVVDLYGQLADYDRIVPICAEYGVPLIEDAAEALGSSLHGQPAGTFGASAILSFNGNKIITTSGGGMFVSHDTAAVSQVRHLATQARQPTVHYEHESVGYNYRLSNLLAALGCAQLERLDAMSARRRDVNQRYRAVLAESTLSFMPLTDDTVWNGWLTCVLFENQAQRNDVMAALEIEDVESRPLWKPMHQQPVFANARSVVDGTSDDLFQRGLCLPSGSTLADTDVDRIADIVLNTLQTTG